MKRSSIIGLFLILVIALIAMLMNSESDKYDWYSEMNELKDDQPYGLQFFKKYMHERFPDDQFHYLDSSMSIGLPKLNETDKTYNYFFIGYNNYLDTAELETILTFVEDGNNAFFFAKSFPYSLMEELNDQSCLYEWYDNYSFQDSTIYANLEDPAFKSFKPLEYSWKYKDRLSEHNWQYVDGDNFCEESDAFEVLGKFNQNQVNYFRAEYGDGYFYFHTNPEFFTNYHLTFDDHQQYAENTLSYATGDVLIWDKNLKFTNFNHEDLSQGKGPLKFILSQESLKWALYVLIGALALYMFLEVKRKQRTIPILSPKQNTSIEYVETISELYFQRKGHPKIFSYINSQFLEFVRKRYRLSTMKIDEEFAKTLSTKSHVQRDTIDSILKYQQTGSFDGNLNEEFLIKYHEQIQYFYNHCK